MTSDRSKRLEEIEARFSGVTGVSVMDIKFLLSEIRSLEKKLEIAKESLQKNAACGSPSAQAALQAIERLVE